MVDSPLGGWVWIEKHDNNNNNNNNAITQIDVSIQYPPKHTFKHTCTHTHIQKTTHTTHSFYNIPQPILDGAVDGVRGGNGGGQKGPSSSSSLLSASNSDNQHHHHHNINHLNHKNNNLNNNQSMRICPHYSI